MPCDIGYKNVVRVVVSSPVPQEFKEKIKPPEIDRELLDKIGEDDPEFLAWARDLDVRPLLEEALKRALAKVPAEGINFKINLELLLEASGRFFTEKDKRRMADTVSRVSSRWQFEIFGIVAELLDYRITITERKGEFFLEAEEEGKTHPCDYFTITKKGNDATLVFEHFKTRRALEVEKAKFVILAHKLGVKIAFRESTITEGSPFPGEERLNEADRHRHGLKGHDHNHSC
ncbi:MAG: hypothetical protein A3G49_00665 [Candidatus Sungbacteria bacterium RIFCSPLOWO2_12_FULL_41_11]|uniref:Uncharacterized protein n=1 Tax=Candidatus Sungbacteria bacterium RIFCSPLOWO2_12_FULL_41_11 TaxID=1802286 RepID=A0A1G2LNV6_9BACT|nr:MAG: hypothetical protein UV01_C0014G0011 [Parcubacteria group bacterium GW2011_GWA2_42_14]OHA13308.1 MAG: hypothetical protein A3G49_00665 [Candidatus Sungbacteria bacterium RIFCSPLOWO2_12_FULL_41_11]